MSVKPSQDWPRTRGINVSDATSGEARAAAASAREHVTGQPRQATYWRDTAMALSDDLATERDVSLREAKRAATYQLLALAGWIMFTSAMVNGWAV